MKEKTKVYSKNIFGISFLRNFGLKLSKPCIQSKSESEGEREKKTNLGLMKSKEVDEGLREREIYIYREFLLRQYFGLMLIFIKTKKFNENWAFRK
jgi:hypothetical protein